MKRKLISKASDYLCAGYLDVPDRYVYPFKIDEGDKIRTIITYNNDPALGQRLRNAHEIIEESFRDNFLDRNPNSYAYHKGVRTIDALENHLYSNYFIKLDIHNFFESITEETFFEVYPDTFNKNWRNILKHVFYKGHLSIGFVTSPTISDFFMSKFDRAIEGYIASNPALHYSRYSDDMLISSEEDNDKSLNALFDFIKEQLEAMHLEINDKKTKRVHLELEKHNALTFLGLNISKADEKSNKITISKRYILFLLFLIAKNKKYNSRCRELLAEINSRVAYLAYNSPVSFNRFQKKHTAIYGVPFDFDQTKLNSRKVDDKAENIQNYEEISKDFSLNLHSTIVNRQNGRVISRNGVTLTAYNGKDEVVEVPNIVNAIGPGAFRSSKVKKVILHEGVMAIGEGAFDGTALEEINLPKSLVYLDYSVFANTSKLKEIAIPVNLLVIPNNLFYRSSIEKISFAPKAKLKRIESIAFAYSDLKEIAFPENVEKIGNGAFSHCQYLESIRLNKKITSIPDSCFEFCHSLEEMDFGDTVLSIGQSAFKNCINLKRVHISENVVSIPDSSFQNNVKLKDIVIDKNNQVYTSRSRSEIVEIGSKKLIFCNDTPLLNEDIEIIGSNVFNSNRDITELNLSNIKEIQESAFSSCLRLRKVTFSSKLEKLHMSAFNNCISLEEVELPTSITVIPTKAFMNCNNLKKVTLGNNVTVIDKEAFSGDYNLESITFPETLKKIKHNAFASCYKIKEIHIGKNVDFISPFAFLGLSACLEKIIVDPYNTAYSDGEGSNVLINRKTNTLMLACTSSKVPDGVKAIGSYAFAYVNGIERIELPDSVNQIGKCAFSYMGDLKSINLNNIYFISEKAFFKSSKLEKANLPTSLTDVGAKAFAYTSLKEVVIPTSLVNINDWAFNNIDSLEYFKIPSNMQSFNLHMFDGCGHIKRIEVDPNNPIYDSRMNSNAIIYSSTNTLIYGCQNTKIPSSVVSLSWSGANQIENLEELVIPEGIVSLQSYMFSNCFNLKKVTLPSTLVKIGYGVFKGCVSLKEINFPKSLSSIGNSAFSYCNSLEEVELPGVIDLGCDVFSNCANLKKVSIYFDHNVDEFSIPSSLVAYCPKLEEFIIKDLKDNDQLHIDDSAFRFCRNLTSLSFDRQVLSIASYAFANCDKLHFNLSPEIVSIGKQAFENVHFDRIDLPASLYNVEADSFLGSDISSITVDPKNTDFQSPIGSNVVLDEKGETLIFGCKSSYIPNGVKMIEPYAFSQVKGLKKVDFPASTIKVGKAAFFEATDLESVVFHSKEAIEVQTNAFMNCKNLKEVKGLLTTKFRNGVFLGCESLEDVEFPSTLEAIEAAAFNGCKSLKRIHIPAKTKAITNSAFDFPREKLEAITVDKDNPVYSDGGSNVLMYHDETLLVGCKNSVIPINTKYINIRAFYYVDGLKKIDFPEGLLAIYEHAFVGCNGLESISIPSTLNYFTTNSFVFCKDLKEIKVSEKNKMYHAVSSNLLDPFNTLVLIAPNAKVDESVHAFGPGAFSCNELREELYIPKYITKIDSLAMSVCESVKKIVVDKDNPIFTSYEDSNAIILKESNTVVLASSISKLPSSVLRYGQYCFIKDDNVKEVFVPKEIRFINPLAFDRYEYLEKIVVDKDNPYFMHNKDNTALIIKENDKVLIKTKKYVAPDNNELLKEHLRGKGTRFYSTGGNSFLDEDDLPF